MSIFRILFASLCLLTSSQTFAAFVESAVGNAVVNDATAIYYNPAVLPDIPNIQIVASESTVTTLNTFSGMSTQIQTNYIQQGKAASRTYDFLPSFYLVYPVNKKISIGIGELYTFYGTTDFGDSSILRYSQVSNYISVLNLMGAIGYKVTNKFSIGAGIDVGYGKIALTAMSGFPTLGVADVKSSNYGSDMGIGGHVGILYKFNKATTLGLTYHSLISYNMAGNSKFHSQPAITTNSFHIGIVTPPSQIISINHFINKKLAFIVSLQRMEWSRIRNLYLQNVAFKIANKPVILPSAIQSYYLRNAWRLTLGANYQLTPTSGVRISVSNDEEPTNPNWHLATGDNVICALGASYKMNKKVKLDITYAHIFFEKLPVKYATVNNAITGATHGSRDVLGFKLTVDMGL